MSALYFLSIPICAKSQDFAVSERDSIPGGVKGSTFFGLPLVFYTPETRWGFGAAAFLSFRFDGEPEYSRPSQLQLGGAYTLENQILAYLPFQLYWDDEKYTTFGELGWYRYNYFFYGIGNDVPEDFEELYGVDYPRIRATFMREFFPEFYSGIRLVADDFKTNDLDPEGLLADQRITGSGGGLNAALGVIFNFDNRDNYFESHSGTYAELDIDRYGAYVGSDFEYTQLRVDIRSFYTFSQKNVIAFNIFSESIYGDAPFISLALLGGNKRMRGFYEGRYRDKTSAIFQAEYRRDIIGRLGAIAFASSGAVGNGYDKLALTNIRFTYGAGLRFAVNKEDRINIRLDAGVGNGQPAFYLTIGEAF